jgi:hypothetical protein
MFLEVSAFGFNTTVPMEVVLLADDSVESAVSSANFARFQNRRFRIIPIGFSNHLVFKILQQLLAFHTRKQTNKLTQKFVKSVSTSSTTRKC